MPAGDGGGDDRPPLPRGLAALTGERLTGIGKAARDLGLSKHVLRRAVRTGELPAYQFGVRMRLRVADVHAWVAAHRQR